jgi:hypothetical protein
MTQGAKVDGIEGAGWSYRPTPLELRAARWHALWQSIVRRDTVSEHILPLVIAAIAGLYAVYRWLSPTMPELLGG